MRSKGLLFIAAVAVSTGCYKATIETGRPASGQTVRQDWAHSFIGGLVPPSTVNTASQCPNGVARVQTQLSFLNMVANAVTFGIYSPMSILVECAASDENENEDAALAVTAGASLEDATRVFNAAVTRSAELQAPVLVRFE